MDGDSIDRAIEELTRNGFVEVPSDCTCFENITVEDNTARLVLRDGPERCPVEGH